MRCRGAARRGLSGRRIAGPSVAAGAPEKARPLRNGARSECAPERVGRAHALSGRQITRACTRVDFQDVQHLLHDGALRPQLPTAAPEQLGVVRDIAPRAARWPPCRSLFRHQPPLSIGDADSEPIADRARGPRPEIGGGPRLLAARNPARRIELQIHRVDLF